MVFDIGRNLSPDIVDYILSLDGLDKYLVATQSLETVNVIPHIFKLRVRRDYKNWNLVINRHVNVSSISESEISSIFHGSDVGLNISRSYYVPDVYRGIVRQKAARECVYGLDEGFDRSIDEIALGWMEGNRSRRTRFGLF